MSCIVDEYILPLFVLVGLELSFLSLVYPGRCIAAFPPKKLMKAPNEINIIADLQGDAHRVELCGQHSGQCPDTTTYRSCGPRDICAPSSRPLRCQRSEHQGRNMRCNYSNSSCIRTYYSDSELLQVGNKVRHKIVTEMDNECLDGKTYYE